MPNTIIFHGTGSSPHDFWFPWLQKELEDRGHSVWLKQLPDADSPCREAWLEFVKRECTFDEETVLVGHSAGCPLILSALEATGTRVKKIVLVAGFAYKLNENEEDKLVQAEYDWKKIRNNVGSVITINSDNDPWGCDDKAGRYIFDNLGGTLIIRHGEGHMGSLRFNQPYREFPLLLELVTSEAM
jgi:predicted alpha/beta hydrolase family esterase